MLKIEITIINKLEEEYGRPDFVLIDVEGFECEVLKGWENRFKTNFLIEVRNVTAEKVFQLLEANEVYSFNQKKNISKIKRETDNYLVINNQLI